MLNQIKATTMNDSHGSDRLVPEQRNNTPLTSGLSAEIKFNISRNCVRSEVCAIDCLSFLEIIYQLQPENRGSQHINQPSSRRKPEYPEKSLLAWVGDHLPSHIRPFAESGIRTRDLRENVTLLDVDSPKYITLQRGHVIQLQPSVYPLNAAFVVCQAHSQKHSVTLSLTPDLSFQYSKTGTNVGVISLISFGVPTWYLVQNITDSLRVVTGIFFGYNKDPIPGGCNLEFNLELDPNTLVLKKKDAITLEYQFANVPYNDSNVLPFPSCEDSKIQSTLSYHAHVYYIDGGDFSEDSYFKAITSMMTPNSVSKNSRKIASQSYANSGKPEFTVASYQGQGVVYAIVVTWESESHASTAIYIPKATYDCDFSHMDENCKHIDIQWYIVAVLGAVIGIFLCVLGHRYFKTGNFILAFLAFSLCIYIVFEIFTSVTALVNLLLTVILSLVGAVLWLSLWYCMGVPALSVLLPSFVAGYIVSSVIFYTPFANLSYWSKDFNYGMSFTCGVLIVPVIMLVFTKTLNILTCAFVGSYSIVLMLDIFLHAGMKYIIINSLRHSTSKSYYVVTVTGPFTTKEIVLTCIWAVLFIGSAVFQFLRERGRPDFPESPKRLCTSKEQKSDEPCPPIPWRQRITEDDDENTPLIRDGHVQSPRYDSYTVPNTDPNNIQTDGQSVVENVPT
ncbi:hypothetical protein FSP39_023388 [Pinctada imbricata]|uniref:TM7S3/TM198-like domain-containing protein n=1 Tax=Pinctada imbricata TaxID=66713 RepID=A0AA89C7G4_PINIB|nr:hypothetical protein FSP39_023388 [Pinctada imbricata]